MPTHWKKLTNPNYIGAYAFEQGEEKTGTIDYVKNESVMNADGKSEDCIVCHFKEKNLKPLILNKTNCKTITKLYNTPYIENWAGKKITMYVKQVKAFGDVTDAVRIRDKVKAEKVPDIKCEDCGKTIKGMGQYGPEFVAAKNKERYGKCLCIECGKKAQADMEKEVRQAQVEAANKVLQDAQNIEEPQDDLVAQLMEDAKE